MSGKDSNGNKVHVSATSGADGKWSANVPSGTYTVTPPAGFVPQSKTMVVEGDTKGIDFATCGVLGSSTTSSRHNAASAARPAEANGESGLPKRYRLGDAQACGGRSRSEHWDPRGCHRRRT